MKILDYNGLKKLITEIKDRYVVKETGKGLSVNDFTTEEKNKLSGLFNYTHPDKHPADIITQDQDNRFVSDNQISAWNNKVDIEAGKGLSTEDYITADKNKLAGVEDNANNYEHPDNHAPAIITQDVDNRFVKDTDITNWNLKTDDTTANAHIGNDVIHVTADDKTAWNSKTDDTTANGHINNLTPHVTADDKTRLGNTVLSTVQTLTTGQKAQARANIGTLKIEDSNYAYEVIFNILTQTGFMILPIRQSYVLDISKFDPFKGTLIEEGKGYIYVPDNLVAGYKTAPNWVTYASQIFGLTALTEVPAEMFKDNLLLTSYPYRPTKMGRGAFWGAKNLESIDLTECTVLPFRGLSGTKISGAVVCPATIVGQQVFNCTLISSFDGSPTRIDHLAFYGCANLTKLILRGNSVCTIGNITVFRYTPIEGGTGLIYVPDNLVEAYKVATNWITFASQIKGISELP